MRRRGCGERVLVCVRGRPGHVCRHAFVVVVIVAWQGLLTRTADDLYSYLSSTLPHHGLPTDRRCAANKEKTCGCQGEIGGEDGGGASFTFGCSWSMYFNACKFARSRNARKFKTMCETEDKVIEDRLEDLADTVAQQYVRFAPRAYANQVYFSREAQACRLGRKEGGPFTGVTACVDFCAHAHRDQHNMNNGSTVVATLTRHRGLDKPGDEQLHVLPFYTPADTTARPGLEVLTRFRMRVRKMSKPLTARKNSKAKSKAMSKWRDCRGAKRKLFSPAKRNVKAFCLTKPKLVVPKKKKVIGSVAQRRTKKVVKQKSSESSHESFMSLLQGEPNGHDQPEVFSKSLPQKPMLGNWRSQASTAGAVSSQVSTHDRSQAQDSTFSAWRSEVSAPNSLQPYPSTPGTWRSGISTGDSWRSEPSPAQSSQASTFGSWQNPMLDVWKPQMNFCQCQGSSSQFPAPQTSNNWSTSGGSFLQHGNVPSRPLQSSNTWVSQGVSPGICLQNQAVTQSQSWAQNSYASPWIPQSSSNQWTVGAKQEMPVNMSSEHNYSNATANQVSPLRSGFWNAGLAYDCNNSNITCWPYRCMDSESQPAVSDSHGWPYKSNSDQRTYSESGCDQDKYKGPDSFSVGPGIPKPVFATRRKTISGFSETEGEAKSNSTSCNKRSKLEQTPEETIHVMEDYYSDNEKAFADSSVGGVAIALTHGSLLFEVAKREVHATTALRRPDRRNPTRISLVFYQHKNMNAPNHNFAAQAKIEEENREKRRLEKEKADLAACNGQVEREETVGEREGALGQTDQLSCYSITGLMENTAQVFQFPEKDVQPFSKPVEGSHFTSL